MRNFGLMIPSRRRPVRILFHLDYLWLGGLEKQAAHIVLGLDRTRFEPVVSWSRKYGSLGRQLADAGIQVIQINPQDDPQCSGARIRELEPNIFHTFSCTRGSEDVRAAQSAGVPVIITNRDSVRFWDPDRKVQSWERERSEAAYRITACSQAVADVAASVEGLPAGQIVMIYNGAAIPDKSCSGTNIREELRLPGSTRLIGYAATYRSVKGHEVLLRAFREVADREPAVHLVCCGEEYDDTRTRLQSLSRELNMEDHVSLLGPREDIDSVYRGLTLYAHSSFSEGFSNAILEAMAHALPVVATAVGGTPECVVDGVTGLLVPPGDSRALAKAILRLVDDEAACGKLGQAGLDRVRQYFSIEGMVNAYQQVYSEAFAHGA